MPEALAYLLTWSTHGAHFHGDNRGSVDRSGDHGPGRPLIAASSARVAFERSEIGGRATSLNAEKRAVVESTIRDHLDHRGWGLLALHVRIEHLHLVVRADETPEKVMGECKAWCTRRLRDAGLVGHDEKVWTRHGSTRHLFTEESLTRAIRYLRDEQGRPLA